MPVKRLLFVEPQFAGGEHTRLNAGIIESFAHAAPGAEAVLASAEKHFGLVSEFCQASPTWPGAAISRLALEPVSAALPKAKALSLSAQALRRVGTEAAAVPGTLVVFLGMTRISRLAALFQAWPRRIPFWAVVHADYQEIGDSPSILTLQRSLFALEKRITPVLLYSPDAIPRRDRGLAQGAVILPHPLPLCHPRPVDPPELNPITVGLFGTASRYIDGLEEAMSLLKQPLRRTRLRALSATKNPGHLARVRRLDPEAPEEFLPHEEVDRRTSECHLALWLGDRMTFRARASSGLVDPLAYGLPILAWESPLSAFMGRICPAIRVVKDAEAMAAQLGEWDRNLDEAAWQVMVAQTLRDRESLSPPRLGESLRGQSDIFRA